MGPHFDIAFCNIGRISFLYWNLSLTDFPYHYFPFSFANSPGDLGSIPGHVIPKTLKMVLDASLLNTQQYKWRIKGKVDQSKESSSALPTPQCSSYWKGSLLVALDYGHQLYLVGYEKTSRNSSVSAQQFTAVNRSFYTWWTIFLTNLWCIW